MNPGDWWNSILALLAAHPVLERLCFASIELAVLAVVLAAFLRLFPIRSARLASLLWLVLLIKPAVTLCVPPLVPVVQFQAPVAVDVLPDRAGLMAHAAGPSVVDTANAEPAPVLSLPKPIKTRPTALVPSRSSDTLPHSPAGIADSPLAAPPNPARRMPSLPTLLVLAWLTGIGLMLFVALVDRLRLAYVLRAATPPLGEVAASHRALARALGLRFLPRLLQTDRLDSPALVGFVRPTILLPGWLVSSGPTSELEWALRHELTHWKHRDPWANLLRQAVQAVFFFHPAAWLAGRKWEEATELACDRALVGTSEEARHYAESLYQLLSRLHARRRRYVPGGLFATRTQVGKRIAALATAACTSPARLGWMSLFTLAVFAALTLVFGGKVVNGASTMPAVEAATVPPSVSENALELDGEDDYYEVAPDPALDLGDSYSIEAWICFDEGGTLNPRILSKGWEARGGYELVTLSTSDSRPVGFLMPGPHDLQSECETAAGQWFHVTVVCDSGNVTLYINGLAAGQKTCPSIRPNRSALNIGRNSDTGRDYFHGKIGEVCLWNVARSQHAIRAGMAQPVSGDEPGLVACWRPQKGTKEVLNDIGPHRLHAYHGSQKSTIEASVENVDGRRAGIVQLNPWRLVERSPDDTGTPQGWPARVDWTQAGSDHVWVNLSNTQTDHECTFDELPPGTYRVSAHTVHQGNLYDPTPFGFSEPIVLESGGGSHEVVVQLMPGCQTVLSFVDAKTEAPVPCVEYIVTCADGFPVGYGSGDFHLRTGEDGVAQFSALPPGKYALIARTSPGGPEDPLYSLQSSPLTFDVREDGQDVEVAMDARRLTQDEVENRWPFSAFGTVTDEDGAPVPGAKIWANCGMGTLLQTGHTVSREDGTYTLHFGPGMSVLDESTGEWGVGHQAASIFSSKEGYYEHNLCRQGGLTMAGERPGPDNVWHADPDQVVLPHQPYRLDFVMAPAARIEGHLVDPEGRPLPGRQVTLTGKELPPSSSVIGFWDTDDDGRFTTGALPCKPFWFEVHKGRDEIKSAPFRLTVPGTYTATLAYTAGQHPRLTCTFDNVPSAPSPAEMIAQAKTKPDLDDTLADKVVELGYVDETEEGKKSLGASGHAVAFERPPDAAYMEAVQVYASRYGNPQPPDDNFHLYILNDQFQILADIPLAYGLIDRGAMRWYTLRTPSIEVPERFYVGLAFNPHQTKGVYLGFDESVEKTHSLTGLPGEGYEPVEKGFDWMVRAFLAENPSGEQGTMRLADWSPPVYVDPFDGCVEVGHDDGESDGIQSYGGAGPAVEFSAGRASSEPAAKQSIMGLRVYGGRYGSGYDPDTTLITVTVLNDQGTEIHREQFPYALFNHKEKWVDLAFQDPVPSDSLDTSKGFMVAIDPEAHQSKGIYFHYNKDPENSHSFRGTVAKGFEPTPDREWMIRVYLARP